MKRAQRYERVFKCPDCNEISMAYKRGDRLTKAGHIKHMWCWKCKAEKGFIQIKNY